MNSHSGAQDQHERMRQEAAKMLVGKRPRPSPSMIRRTTSMGGIVVHDDDDDDDDDIIEEHGIKDPPADHHHEMPIMDPPHHKAVVAHPINVATTGPKGFQQHLAMHNTPHFLRTCGLCKRALAPARDIYMYRGDTAFCSLECREKQMRQDERKEKWNKVVASTNKQQVHHSASPPPPPPPTTHHRPLSRPH